MTHARIAEIEAQLAGRTGKRRLSVSFDDLALLLRLVEHYEQALRENVNDISEDPSARIWAKTLLAEAAKIMESK